MVPAAAVIFLWMASRGLSFAITPGGSYVLLGPACMLLGLIVRPSSNSRRDRLVASIETLGIFATICTLGAIACYPAAAMSHGFVDPLLARMDRALGFDWLAYYRLEQASHALYILLKEAYSSIFITPSVIIVALVMSGRSDRAYGLILIHAAALAISIGIFIAMPATGADVFYLGLHAPDISDGAVRQVAMITSMQSGQSNIVSAAALIGPISFPSFHMASALLFIWAAWPMRRLRWIMLGVNLLMIAATPLHGGHYFVDLIGGAVIMTACILALRPRGSVVAARRPAGDAALRFAQV
jgi:hypothetical protein